MRRRFLSVLLSAAMMFSCFINVEAGPVAEATGSDFSYEREQAEEEELEFKDISEETESNLEDITEETTQHPAESVNDPYQLEITDISGNETKYRIRLTFNSYGSDSETESSTTSEGASVTESGSSSGEHSEIISGSVNNDATSYSAAIWSQDKGQDDLRWVKLARVDENIYEAIVSIKDYNSSGLYHCHVYQNTGKMKLLSITTFEVSKVSAESLTVENVDMKNGTCDIILSGVACSSGVCTVQIPVWSKSDQSDIKWYRAMETEPGVWTVKMSLNNHRNKTGSFNTGTFHIHAYGTNGNGHLNYITNSSVYFEEYVKPVSVSATESSDGATWAVRAVGIEQGAFSTVYAAVWSATDGQDDIKWYSLSAVADSGAVTYTGSIDIRNHKTLGKYYLHLYGVTAAGEYQLLDHINFDVRTNASAAVTVSGLDTVDSHGVANGQFTVSVTISETSWTVNKVTVPVWSASDQSDIVWYQATKQSDGTWKVTVDIANHKNHTGNYNIHVYATFANGIQKFVGNTKATYSPAKMLTVSSSSGKRVVRFQTSETYSSVRAAVWSQPNGQDDLKWLDMSSSGNVWTLTVKGSDFETAGNYFCHLYTGTNTFLGAINFSFSESEVSAKWVWPLPSSHRITSYFGPREAPTAGASSYHMGLDIGAASGSEIVAVAAGNVTGKGYDDVRGYYVFVTLANGIQTLSQHMCQPAIVNVGQKVSRGQVIGYVGSTGVATGPHLHFSVIVNGNYVDPLPYLS